MKENKVVAMCPKCTKKDVFTSVSSNRRRFHGEKYELHVCSRCGEKYLAHTYGYYSILRFHGDNFIEQMESILEITPEHFDSFIEQIKKCGTEQQILTTVQKMHGEVAPISNEAYERMLDTSLMLTEDVCENVE